jgi:hypothetical protein
MMMASGLRCLAYAAFSSSLLLAPAALAQSSLRWSEPPDNPAGQEEQPGAVQARDLPQIGHFRKPSPTPTLGPVIYRLNSREREARDFALKYLNLWSSPNPVALAASASFYAPSVSFHGHQRSRASVLEEKRRFAARWPDRVYDYRPGTMQVACEAAGTRCTVWSIFDFVAGGPHGTRRSAGIGDHELVVSFTGKAPVIVSETSRVLLRGAFPFLSAGASSPDGLSACREAISRASEPYGGTKVSIANADSTGSVGSSLSFDAKIEYRDGSHRETRAGRVTCKLGADGHVEAIR